MNQYNNDSSANRSRLCVLSGCCIKGESENKSNSEEVAKFGLNILNSK